MALKVSKLLRIVDLIVPFRWAYDWDNVGLIVGRADSEAKTIAICLDITREILTAAKRRKADAIICHHPPLFKPLKQIALDSLQGEIIAALIKLDIACIAVHTNLDRSPQGTNQALAQALGLKNIAPLARKPVFGERFKFMVFVPEGFEEKIITAIANAGGGVIGEYTHCTFRSPGTGTFLPLDKARPYIGERGRLEQVKENRLEAVVPKERLAELIREVIAAHPYEEPAYDVYPLYEPQGQYGVGCLAEIPRATSLGQFARRVKQVLQSRQLVVVGKSSALVKTVVLCAGAGKEALESINTNTADVFLTGELGYHELHAAEAKGLNVILAGHYETERPVVTHLAQLLQQHPEIKRHKPKLITLL